MSGWRVLPFALLAAALAACVRPALGARATASFWAVETQHFTLYTDLDADDAQEQAQRLEQLLAALQETGWEATGDLPLRMNVVMFADSNDFRRFARDEVGGFAIAQELFEPWMVLPAPRFGEDFGVVAHELTHVMSYQAIMRQPKWLSEGLASYFESAHFHIDGSFQVGAVPKARFRWLRLGWDAPSQLLGHPETKADWRFYSSSWLLVHFLMTKHADGFVTFQDQLARGLTVSDAWLKAFPTLPRDALDQAVEDYARAGHYESYIFDLGQRASVRTRIRRLSFADEHALLALLWRNCFECESDEQARAQRALERALQLEPNNVWATALKVNRGIDDSPSALASAQALVRAHPEHWLSWVVFGLRAMQNMEVLIAMIGNPETDPGVRAARLAPTQPYALALRAMTAALRGERESAVSLVKAAQRMQPTNSELMGMRVLVLLVVSACAEAGVALEEVGENAHADVDPRTYHELRAQVQACKEGKLSSAGRAPSAPSVDPPPAP